MPDFDQYFALLESIAADIDTRHVKLAYQRASKTRNVPTTTM